MIRIALWGACVWCGSALVVQAQMRAEPVTPPMVPFYQEEEIPRAQPVRPEPPTPPAVPFDAVPVPRREPPTPPAVPFDAVPPPTVTVAPTPTPEVQRTVPSPEIPRAVDAPRAAADQRTVDAESLGEPEIRMAPATGGRSPEDAQFDVANSLYTRKMFEYAAVEYDNYLRMHPQGSHRQAAFFRMGESYRAMGNINNARNAYESLLAQFRDGEFIGPTAYRLAEMYFSAKDYRSALPLFEIAGQRVKNPSVRLASQYREARCLELLDRPESARAAYRSVVAVKKENPYRDASLLSLAQIASQTRRKQEALGYYEQLAKSAENPETQAEAAVKGGVLAVELKEKDRARGLLESVLKNDKAGQWSGMARLGLLRLAYEEGRYEDVIKTYTTSTGEYPADLQPEVLLLVGNSHRQLGRFDSASKVYDEIVARYHGRVEAKEAEFQRLISLYSMGDPAFSTRIDEFLAANPEGAQADQARLLKAESHYKAKDYVKAAEAYASISGTNLRDDMKAEAMFRLAWCLMETKQIEQAMDAYTAYLRDFPEHDQVPSALAQRGLCRQQLGRFDEALADFNQLIEQHPKAREREVALQRKALILGQQQDNAGMAETFEILLADYPSSAAGAQANYWIGWVRFNDKKYREALPYFERARNADAESFKKQTALRIVLAHYYLEDVEKLTQEVDAYLAEEHDTAIPGEVLRWLGLEYYNEDKHALAVKYLGALAERENPVEVPADVWLFLGRSRIETKQFIEAEEALNIYLGKVKEPAALADGQLALARAQIGSGLLDAARESVDGALQLQPEGRLNAEARILGAEIELARGNPEDAAKAFMTVGVLYEDPEITPRALEKASLAYASAGDTTEADKVMNQLRTRFPEYKLTATQ